MSAIIDIDAILSENEQWKKLEEEWGVPIDLEVDTEDDTPRMRPVFSTLNLKSPTFDSSFLFKKVTRKLGRQLSKRSTTSALEYNDFISHLRYDPSKESSKQFYFVNGQIMSAASIDDICEKIDDIFKSIEQLSTSTIKKKNVPDVVQCSISATDLSFDDTLEETNYSEIEKHIDEAFEQFNSNISGIEGIDQTTIDSVTSLVRKFSNALNNPVSNCSPRRRKECCEKFRELADFWKNRAFE
ncbi:unnamed protein product, partial [Brenthis ino]